MVGDRAVEAVGELALGGVIPAVRSRQKRGRERAERSGARVVESPLLGEVPDPLSDQGNLCGPGQSFATQTGRSAIGTWPFGHGLPLGFVLTQLWLTCEKAWLGPQADGPAAVVVLPLVLVVEVAVVDVVGVVVGVVVGAVVWVGCACSVTVVVVLLPPQAETTRAITMARADATTAYLTDFTGLPSEPTTGRLRS